MSFTRKPDYPQSVKTGFQILFTDWFTFETPLIDDPLMKSLLILYVEDDIDDRELFLEATARVNSLIRCFTASTVQQALQMLREKNAFLPDFIFTDLNLPGENGKVLLKEITKDPALDHIPVIIYTTSSSQTERDECIKLGATAFITKPSSFNEICNAIRKTIAEKEN